MNDKFVLELSDFKFVSFDIFDTLIYRTFKNPSDVFEATEKIFNKSNSQSIEHYKLERVHAESRARRENKGKEITIDQIYQELPYSDSVKDSLKSIEIQVEIDNCVPNQIMVDILNHCKKKGKYIVIITDMYLPKCALVKILDKINVSYDYLFVSSEEGVTKRSGLLFSVVLEKLKIKCTDIIHIGDDMNNDIIQPRKYGIKSTLRLEKKTVELPYKSKNSDNGLERNHLSEFLKRGLQNYGVSSNVIIGYSILGPLLWEFCEWVHSVKEEQRLDKLLFVAREGWCIMKCYEIMYPEDRDIISYVRLNKNLLRLPSLMEGDVVKNFLRSIPARSTFLWGDILKYFSLDGNVNEEVTENYGLDVETMISYAQLNEPRFRDILKDIILSYYNKISHQNSLLKAYLDEHGLIGNRVGLVNNSMNGSGQHLVEEYAKNKKLSCDILGIQFVCSKKCIHLLGHRSVGWMNEHIRPSYKTFKHGNAALVLEHLMFEPTGTAIVFKESNGFVDVVCETPRLEKNDFGKIKDVQNFATKFVSEYKEHIGLSLGGEGFERYFRLLLNPEQRDAFFLCSIWDDDVEGDHQIVDSKARFRIINSVLTKMPPNTGWFEGWFAEIGVPVFYKRIAHLRAMIRYYKHHVPFFNDEYC